MQEQRPAPGTPALTFGQIDDLALGGLRPPRLSYYLVLALLAGGVGGMFLAWLLQIRIGLGITGLHEPIDWAVYITNFVFWVGIGHAGTLISAILHLARAKWRDAVSRSAEAMTVFAVMIAGLFPLVHLGRVWVVYYILPYPSQRQLWPNFLSPLLWDVLAITTYLTVSAVFFIVGLVPDAASARDLSTAARGPNYWRAWVFRVLSMDWTGSGTQWRHYDRAYLFFAALATPLVISVHSVVSWDFAMSLLPGWHSTLFAPYFVAGAIHSGLAMVLTLMLPMRRILGLKAIITDWHLEQAAKTLLVTTAIVAYAYVLEPLMAWYSGDVFERQLALFRATGWAAFVYWPLFILNVLAPLAFVFKRARRSPVALFVVSILVNIGMWLERFMIITSSMGHDFLPNNWSAYLPRPVEIAITLGSFAMFFFLFLGFTKLLPTVPMTDLKRLVEEGRHEAAHRAGPATPDHEPALGAVADAPEAQVPLVPPVPKGHDLPPVPWTTRPPRQGEPGAVLVYAGADSLVAGLRMACEAGFHRLETYTPIRVEAAEHLLGRGKSPVRMFALAGGLTGMAAGFGLATFAAMRNSLIVGGKWPFAPIPYMIPAFEGTILLGALGNLAGLLVSARLYRVWQLLGPAPVLDPRFTRDRFGLFVACQPEDLPRLRHAVAASRPEDIHVRA